MSTTNYLVYVKGEQYDAHQVDYYGIRIESKLVPMGIAQTHPNFDREPLH